MSRNVCHCEEEHMCIITFEKACQKDVDFYSYGMNPIISGCTTEVNSEDLPILIKGQMKRVLWYVIKITENQIVLFL